MQDNYLHVIYCDDIRQEVGGKQSFMGIYNAELALPSFPAVIPKLCTHINLNFSIDVEYQNLSIEVSRDGEVMAAIPLPEGELHKMRSAILKPDEQDPLEFRRMAIALAVQFQPLEIKSPGQMRVRAILDGQEIRGNGLRIRAASQVELDSVQQPTPA